MLNNYIIKNNLNSGKDIFDTHLHDKFEINFMLTENVEVVIEDKFFLSQRGDVFIFPPFTFHKIDSNGMEFSRFLMFFNERSMTAAAPVLSPALTALRQTRPLVVHLKREQIKKMLELFGSAYNQYIKNDIFSDFENICSFGKIITYIIQNIDTASPKNDVPDVHHEISKILSYVNNNIDENLTVEGISKKFNVSTTTLWHMMRSNIGISLKEYILKIRIAKAMELLNSGLSVTEVSNRTGFNSYSHFIRTFTKSVGTSPYQYGKQQHG